MRFNYEANKILHLFIRRFFKYLMILFLLIIMLIPPLIISYQNIKQDILNSYSNNINKGLNDLETQINAVLKIADSLKEEESYRNLLRITGTPQSSQFVDISTLQKKLSALCVSHEYITDMYLIFRDNPIYISNFIASDDYHRMYPTFYREQGKTADEWHEGYFNNRSAFQITSNEGVYSSYHSQQNYNALTCTMDIPLYAFQDKRSVLICNFNFDLLVENMVYTDILSDSFLYMNDMDGQRIASYNLPAPLLVSDADVFDEYTIVRSNLSEFGYQIVLGIPQEYFDQKANASFRLIQGYFWIGIGIIFVLSFCLSLKETAFMKKVINTASVLLPFSDNTGKLPNEYTYINNVLKRSASELDHLNSLTRSIALENLFLNQMQRNTSEIQAIFSFPFDFYCVAVIKLSSMPNAIADQHYIFYLEEACQSLIQEPYWTAHTNIDELAFLIVLDDTHRCDLSVLKEEMLQVLDFSQKNDKVYLNIGLSTIASGADHVREAYLQARDTVHIFASNDSSGIFMYNKPRQVSLQKSLDVSLLTKCYEGILCGDLQVVKNFFDQIEKVVMKGYYDQQEPLQLLFSIRQPIYNAYLEIFSNGESENADPTIPFPKIEISGALKKNLVVLKDFAYQLCKQTQLQKYSRQQQLRDNIMEFIRTNCFDPSFSVYTVINEFHVSENYVLQLTRETTGRTFKTHIENLRIEKAEYMLQNEKETNAKIAAACGFGSENTFYRAFSRKHGVTPSKWSEKLK